MIEKVEGQNIMGVTINPGAREHSGVMKDVGGCDKDGVKIKFECVTTEV